ncbi:hypothetical protein [Pyrobaculum sp.]|uniref:hypothetical protein n=1 Tax=Pyrobaculum sp. TaxID=2004705 RepID=UPI003165F34B
MDRRVLRSRVLGIALVGVATVVLAAVVAALFLMGGVGIAAGKPPIPKPKDVFTAVYEARVLCPGGEKVMNLTLVYRGRKLGEIYLGGLRIPPAAFRHPHELSYIGEFLLDLDMVYRVDNRTVGAFGGLVRKEQRGVVSLADSPYKATSVVSVLTSFNYTYLEVEGHGVAKNVAIDGMFLDFDQASGVPYAFQLFIIHNITRQICGTSSMYIYAYLKEVK